MGEDERRDRSLHRAMKEAANGGPVAGLTGKWPPEVFSRRHD
jgi:hypothetical protein